MLGALRNQKAIEANQGRAQVRDLTWSPVDHGGVEANLRRGSARLEIVGREERGATPLSGRSTALQTVHEKVHVDAHAHAHGFWVGGLSAARADSAAFS